jgi:hypothetical protein
MILYGNVGDRRKNGLIEEAIVIRYLEALCPSMEERIARKKKERSARKKTDRSGREGDFIYWVVFVPSTTCKTRDIFLMRDRSGARTDIRPFKSLFTVSQAMEEWGFDEYIVFDAVKYGDYFPDAIDALLRHNRGLKSYEALLENLPKGKLSSTAIPPSNKPRGRPSAKSPVAKARGPAI